MVRIISIFFVALVVLAAANILLVPEGAFVPPTRLYLNERFSSQLALYRLRGSVDYLIAGNSRTRDGIDPAVLSEELSLAANRSVSVHNLGTGGGFFPFYEALFTELIDGALPRNVILGVSPRDFGPSRERAQEVLGALHRSSGYRLEHLPYKQPALSVEGRLSDLAAAVLPALYYRHNARRAIVPKGLIDYVRPTPQIEASAIRNYLWKQLKFASGEIAAPWQWTRIVANGKALAGRLGAAWSWSPTSDPAVNEFGYYPRRLESPEELTQRIARQQEKWAGLAASGAVEKYRYSDYCESRMRIERGPNTSQQRLFDFLAERDVRLHLVMLPAIWLEGCENNIKYNKELVEYIRKDIMSKYKNVISFTDLNNNFSHEFSDIEFYRDLEHISPGQSAAITRKIAAAIARK